MWFGQENRDQEKSKMALSKDYDLCFFVCVCMCVFFLWEDPS